MRLIIFALALFASENACFKDMICCFMAKKDTVVKNGSIQSVEPEEEFITSYEQLPGREKVSLFNK